MTTSHFQFTKNPLDSLFLITFFGEKRILTNSVFKAKCEWKRTNVYVKISEGNQRATLPLQNDL